MTSCWDPEAAGAAADPAPVRARGEISVSWLDQTLHVVGLGIDPTNEALIAGPAQVRGATGRRSALPQNWNASASTEPWTGALRYAGNPSWSAGPILPVTWLRSGSRKRP